MSLVHDTYVDPHRPSDVTDGDLVAALKDGRDWALKEVVARHSQSLLTIAMSVVGPAQAEDVVQDTFLRLVERADEIRDGQALTAWLHRVARNRALDIQRSARMRREVTVDGVPEPSALAGVDEQVETRLLVDSVLSSVRPTDVDLLTAHYLSGRSLAELAEDLGSTSGSIKVRLSRSRRRALDAARRKGIGLLGGGTPGWFRGLGERFPLLAEAPIGAVTSAAILGLGLTLGLGGGGGDDRAVVPQPSPVTTAAPGAVELSGSGRGKTGLGMTSAEAPETDPDRGRAAPGTDASATRNGSETGPGRQPSLTPSEFPRTRAPGTDFEISSDRDERPEYRMQLTPDPRYGVETTDGDPEEFVEVFGQACRSTGTAAPAVVDCAEDQPTR